jgi:MFS family permease
MTAAEGRQPDDEPTTAPAVERSERWLTPGVKGIGAASLLADLGHEIPTALLPSFLTSTLGAPAAALGAIEGVSDGLAGAARLAGGALADDAARRRTTAVGGYTTTAVLSGLIGVAGTTWQAGILRAAAWTARGLRVPARNALLADTVTPRAYGRAYGFERAMDNLGAIGGPLLALALVALVGVREAILLSIIPGLLAAGAIVYAIHHVPRLERHQRQPLRLRLRPVMRGRLGRLMGAPGAFEFGNVAATLLILRATELFEPGRSTAAATQLALVLYTAYNLAASAIAGALWTVISPAAAFIYAAAWMALAVAGLLMTDHGDLRANGEIRRLAPPRASESASLSGLRTACLVRGARRCGSCWRALRDATRVVGGGRGRAARFEITRQSGGRWLAAGRIPLSKR